jgi:hypothetical protein
VIQLPEPLSRFPYQEVMPQPVKLRPRPPADEQYLRPPRDAHLIVPDYYAADPAGPG